MRRLPGRQALALAAVLSGIAPALAQSGATPANCQLHIAAQLDMRTISDGRVTIPVTIDGKDRNFMVDTGGFISTVSRPVAQSAGYAPSHASSALRGAGNSVLDSYVTVKDFGIGGSHGRNFDFYIDDFASLNWDGTLAPEILASYDVDFDFAHEKFNLILPDHCPGKVVYWTDGSELAVVPMQLPDRAHITIPVQLDGKQIMATLDTGSDTSFMNLRAASRYLGIDEKDPRLKPLGQHNINGMTATIYTYPFATMNFGGIAVHNPHIVIVPNNMYVDNDLLMGMGVLRQLHMYIAYKEKKLYLTPALAGKKAN